MTVLCNQFIHNTVQ